MKIAFVFGTRPEILKVAPLIKEAQRKEIQFEVIHTNQHYSYEMDQIFFKELELENPKYNLKIGSHDHNIQTAKMLESLDKVYKEIKPDCVIVQGDTNSTLSGALAASKLGIKVCHVEAGLRSYDKSMPEEINRIITDSISDYLFPVTSIQEEILLKEGTSPEKICVSGNTIVDTLFDRLPSAKENSTILKKMNIENNKFFLLTMHRPSNVDEKEVLISMMTKLDKLAIENDVKVVWPIHPRTMNKITNDKIEIPTSFIICDPLGYLDFLALMIGSKIILTDSGGIQEEACILQKPCITLRQNTERPETISVGANLLVGDSLEKMTEAVKYFSSKVSDWKNPFGNGKVSAKILEFIFK